MSGQARSSKERAPLPSVPEYLQHWAQHTPAQIALREGDTTLTYDTLARYAVQTAAELRGRGVAPGDRVVLVGANTWRWVVAYLATLIVGAIAVPTNTRLSPQQFAHQAKIVDARLVIFDDAFADITQLVTEPLANLDGATSVIATEGVAEWPEAQRGDAPAVISFTSGTTGTPKGALLSHTAITEGSRVFARVLGTDSTDSTLVLVPLFHNTGFVDQLGHMIIVGGRTELLARFKTELAIQELAAHPVTYVTAVPSILRLLMTHPSADRAFSRARTVLYGGSPMPEAWSAEIGERWPSLRLFHGYGLTEFTSAVSFLRPESAAEHLESVGTPAPDVRIMIAADDGSPVPDGETGQIMAAGPTIMTEYWNAPELTAQKIVNGWLATGDLGRVSGGLMYLAGRVDDVINRGGEKVLPAAIESALCELNGVAEACVFPLPDDVLQQRVHAVVRLREGAAAFDLDQAIAALAASFPDYAIPETIRVWDDLPRGASGKVDRRQVIQLRTTETKEEQA